MKQRIFPKVGAPVSEIGLGTWQLSSADWGGGRARHARWPSVDALPAELPAPEGAPLVSIKHS